MLRVTDAILKVLFQNLLDLMECSLSKQSGNKYHKVPLSCCIDPSASVANSTKCSAPMPNHPQHTYFCSEYETECVHSVRDNSSHCVRLQKVGGL